MAYRRFLTQNDLVEAMEVAVLELEDGYVDGVYIPPDVDTLTDEETFDDEAILCETGEPEDIAGTFELQGPADKVFPDKAGVGDSHSKPVEDLQILPGASNSRNLQRNLSDDSSDDETLASIRRKLIAAKVPQESPAVNWEKGEISYTHCPASREFQDKENLKNVYSGKTPLEIFSS